MKKVALIAGLFLLLISTAIGSTEIIYSEARSENDKRGDYYVELLQLILDETKDEYGSYTLTPFQSKVVQSEIVQSRILTYIQHKKGIDIHWTMTSKEREKELLAIRIPLLKGLLGHRIFIIKKENEKKFKNINSINKLKKLKAGQGHDWPDTEILKKNYFEVLTSSLYENLFRMLASDRFDYFPRGINEPWIEIKQYGNGELVIEENLLIQYPAPIYFFVNRENTALAERIEVGLNSLIESGKFNEFFYNHPMIKEMFEQSNLSNRKIFKIVNPLLSDESKKILNKTKYWYTQGDERKYINKK